MRLSLDLSSSSSKFGILTPFCSEVLKVRKTTKNDLKWRVYISESTQGKIFKFSVILSLDLNNSSPRFGILTTFCSEMFKVRKSTKKDFNWKVNISQSTAVKASKFSVRLNLNLSKFCSKFGILTLLCSKMLKVRKSTKNGFNERGNISGSTVAGPSKICLIPWLSLNTFCPKFGVLTIFNLNIIKYRKSAKNDFTIKAYISRMAVAKTSKLWVVLCQCLNHAFLKAGVLTMFNSYIPKVRKLTKNDFKYLKKYGAMEFKFSVLLGITLHNSCPKFLVWTITQSINFWPLHKVSKMVKNGYFSKAWEAKELKLTSLFC